ncbi:WD_REPEATS_REGION domain-containing protein, partial [Modicella reniformis]
MSYNTVSSARCGISPQKTLELANFHLNNARRVNDPELALALCDDAEAALFRIKNFGERALRDGVATAYFEHGKLLDNMGQVDKAEISFKKAEKFRNAHSSKYDGQTSSDSLGQDRSDRDIATIPPHVFTENIRRPAIPFKLPDPDERIKDTQQLAYCVSLLSLTKSVDDTKELVVPVDTMEPVICRWLQVINGDPCEKERLETLVKEVVMAFWKEDPKDDKVITEMVYLSPVLEKDDFRKLLEEVFLLIKKFDSQEVYRLEGLARLIQNAPQGHLEAGDLLKIWEILKVNLCATKQPQPENAYQLMLAVLRVLDAMADIRVKNVDRGVLQLGFDPHLKELEKSSNPFLVYQAAYAYQALQYVLDPDNLKLWKPDLQSTEQVNWVLSGSTNSARNWEVNDFIGELGNIQEGIATGVLEDFLFQHVKDTHNGTTPLAKSGQDFLGSIKVGLSFDRKRMWYPTLRGADVLIRNDQFAKFRKLVCEAPCRRDPAFQWGICLSLGNLAADPMMDADNRRSAVAFLGEIYRNDAAWGPHTSVKQWILDILMQLSSMSDSVIQANAKYTTAAEALLDELEGNGDAKKQDLYRQCLKAGHIPHPLNFVLPAVATPSLLDRVQAKPNVEGTLRQLRDRRLEERDKVVYISPKAKPSLQSCDSEAFPLMEKVEEFLGSERKVLLLLGDSSMGKSTFNRKLEYDLWKKCRKKTGTIPLYINLPAIDKPEHDLITKHLRRMEFTEPQIQELKERQFVLICDGYDESRQRLNLYKTNRLNRQGEWKAQMVISCRTEYLTDDYRDRFQPECHGPGPDLFQEAVIVPFSEDEIQNYIKEYVRVYQPPWQTDDYMEALKHIPNLKDLVKTPFLLSLTLDVLLRIVDPKRPVLTTQLTRLALYDQFLEQWLKRERKRLGAEDMSPQAKATFESLSDEVFVLNGIDYLKKLAVAIYKNQDGRPVVEYSRFKDERTWKEEFFNRDEEKQILRKACPMIQSGNQLWLIHRSLLEYCLTLAVFDPQEFQGWNEKMVPESALNRRGSASSDSSVDIQDGLTGARPPVRGPKPGDTASPLFWRNFLSELSLMQFLEERAQQEPAFEKQLLTFIEHSKTNKEWRMAATNAITILVRAGVQFNGAKLRGIRIPGADLSYGVFDSAQLQEADLRNVKLEGTWLRQADLSGARMKNVCFGDSGTRKTSKTSDWRRIWTLSGQRSIETIAYSPKGDQVASDSQHYMVRLWD